VRCAGSVPRHRSRQSLACRIPRTRVVLLRRPACRSTPAEASVSWATRKGRTWPSSFAGPTEMRTAFLGSRRTGQAEGDTVTQGNAATDAARRAGHHHSDRVCGAGDPVGTGLVTSLARPGGNVTGLTDIAPRNRRKRLDLLREAVPGITRIRRLWNPANSTAAPQMKDTDTAARSVGSPFDRSNWPTSATSRVPSWQQFRATRKLSSCSRRCPLWPPGSDRPARRKTPPAVRRLDSRVR